jgi:hypothetical protein
VRRDVLNCFIIMPFAPEFDDVYASIKACVEGAFRDGPVRCFRLDESRPAGRITDRLLQELQSASFCIADLTGVRPNVMWEVGYVMALKKPTIIVTQDEKELPFDLRDMETVCYDRNHLSQTLGHPLRRVVIDTVSALSSAGRPGGDTGPAHQGELVGELLEQIRELKSIVNQAVRTWSPAPEQQDVRSPERDRLESLEGVWVNRESGTHLYGRVIGGELVMPYCYGGIGGLSSVYYGWKRVGEFWFARYCWLGGGMSGFAFLKQESVELLVGAWWSDDGSRGVPESPNFASGVPSRLERQSDVATPDWALEFFEKVRQVGIVNCLRERRAKARPVAPTDDARR